MEYVSFLIARFTMFYVVCCVGALLVGAEHVLFLLLALIIFDAVSCVGVLLSGEWVFDISLAWYAVNLKRYIKTYDG